MKRNRQKTLSQIEDPPCHFMGIDSFVFQDSSKITHSLTTLPSQSPNHYPFRDRAERGAGGGGGGALALPLFLQE